MSLICQWIAIIYGLKTLREIRRNNAKTIENIDQIIANVNSILTTKKEKL